jgi:hypothetical protein
METSLEDDDDGQLIQDDEPHSEAQGLDVVPPHAVAKAAAVHAHADGQAAARSGVVSASDERVGRFDVSRSSALEDDDDAVESMRHLMLAKEQAGALAASAMAAAEAAQAAAQAMTQAAELRLVSEQQRSVQSSIDDDEQGDGEMC